MAETIEAPISIEFEGMAETTEARRSRLSSYICGALLAISAAVALSRPFTSHQRWMSFVQDDFFYYLKVAQNIVAGKGSTFNGIVQTNGYHPLWLLVITAIVWLGVVDNGLLVFVALTSWIAAMAMYYFAFRLLTRSKVEPVFSAIVALYVGVFSLHLFQYGMEATLATPLMMYVILRVRELDEDEAPSAGYFLGFGLAVSAMILSRLDTALFAATLAILAVMVSRRTRQAVKAGSGWLLIGLLPVPLYLLVNRLYFGTWMPISGIAKGIKIDHGFTDTAWVCLVNVSLMQKIHVAIIAVALLALPWVWSRLGPGTKILTAATLLFPFLYTFTLSWLSDWPLWLWYFYDLRPALCVALLVLLQIPLLHRLSKWKLVQVVAFAGVLLAMVSFRWYQQSADIVDAAFNLRQFSATHPGRYAMGDRSGAAGMLLSDSIVQTEGLMMDKDFLKNIEQQRPLRDVLADYKVRYYVATSLEPFTGCFEAREPALGGSHAPKMRAEFCGPPVAKWMYNGRTTMVFDLQAKQ